MRDHQSSAMLARALSPRCTAALETGAHILLGVSPFNSYFSVARISALVRWARPRFSSVQLFVPDEPARYTLEALGYEPARARHKARRQGNYLKNKIGRALEAVGIAAAEQSAMLVDSAVLEANPRYCQIHAECQELFGDDPDFRNACIVTSSWVLQGRTRSATALGQGALARAAQYLLAEIPLFVSTPSILGQPASVFCYHEAPDVVERLYGGGQRLAVDSGQGFVIVRDAEMATGH